MLRKRSDPRGENTRTALIEAAEDLIAARGIDNVTLRQIGRAIGSDNNAVVSYYFGTKAGLLRAIYEHRIPALESRRSDLLERADKAGLGYDVLSLLFALWAPIFELRNDKGRASYAGFLSSTANSPLISTRILSRSYRSTSEIADRLQKIIQLPEELFWERNRLISMMMIPAIQDAIKSPTTGPSQSGAEAAFRDALRMAASALSVTTNPEDSLDLLSGA